jgi:hypothetical protein
MPVQGIATVTAPTSNTEWKPVPEGVYQVVIKDINERDGKKYQSEEMIVQYLFKFVILDQDIEEQFKNSTLTAFCSTSWFGGSKKGMNPSKLVTIFKAIYGFYYPGVDIVDMEASEADRMMKDNLLIGSQVKVVVKLSDDKSSNKITDFMSIKSEMSLPDDLELGGEIKIKRVEKKESTNPKSEDEFIKGLEEDKELSGEQIAEIFT